MVDHGKSAKTGRRIFIPMHDLSQGIIISLSRMNSRKVGCEMPSITRPNRSGVWKRYYEAICFSSLFMILVHGQRHADSVSF